MRKHQPRVDIARFEKRLLALERKGQEVELIGRKPQPLKVLKERALQRLVRHLVFGDSVQGIGITVSGVPKIEEKRITLGLALDIPLGQRKLRLSREDKKLLERLLVQALEERSRLLRSDSASEYSQHGRRSTPRRASTGS